VHPMRFVLKKFLTAELLRFIVVGIISAAIEFSLLFLFKQYIDYRLANILAFVVTNVITFTLTRRYVFTSNGNRAEEQKLFVLCLSGALLVNHVVLWSLVEYVALDMRLAKIIAISVTVIWNYLTRKNIVFRNRVNALPETSPVKDYPAKKF
jgi:putative flippase GtrA